MSINTLQEYTRIAKYAKSCKKTYFYVQRKPLSVDSEIS